MQEVTVRLNKKHGSEIFELSIPASWEELTREQFLYIAKYWSAWQNLLQHGHSLIKARCGLLIALSGLNTSKQRKRLCRALSFVDLSTDVNILDCTNFVFGELKLTKCLVPTIPVGIFKRYYGPADKLADLQIDEFSFALHCYTQYSKTGNENFLLKLMAVLYRPKNPNYKKSGELRSEFNNKLVDLHEKVLSKCPDEYKHATYIFFRGCMEMLEKRYPEVFTRSKETQRSGGSFIDAVISMSGGKFGPFSETKKENMHVILKELQELIIKSKKEPDK